MKKNLKYNIFWLGLAVIAYVILYFLSINGILDSYLEYNLVMIGINIILATGLNLIIGFSGQFSLGHAGFMAIGAYATAIMSLKNPTFGGFLMGLLIGLLLAGVVAAIVGIPTLRLKGDYLAIATLGVSEIIRVAIVNMESVTQGPSGLFGIPRIATWEVVFGFVVITTLVIVNFIHSGAGRATLAVREDEIAAESMGVNTTKYKVMAFVIGAMTASIAGGLYASYAQTIMPQNFGFMKSVDILIIAVFGGLGSITGTYIAAVVLGILNMYLQNFGDLRMVIYSLALIIIMIFKPGGLLGTKELSFKNMLAKRQKKTLTKADSDQGGDV